MASDSSEITEDLPPKNQIAAVKPLERIEEVFDDYKDARSGSVIQETEEQIVGLRSASKEIPPGYSEGEVLEAKRRSLLAYGILLALVGIIVIHYFCVYNFAQSGKDTKPLESVFNTALPVLAGFAGTAFAFYFKDRK